MKFDFFPSSPERLLSRRDVFILTGAAALALAVFLAFSTWLYRPGFPLDDSWIHQTYARNLAMRGEWAFLPGQISGGSTSPLWTILLAPGFWLGLAPLPWAFGLGFALLLGLGLFAEWIVRRAVAAYRPVYPWVGLVFVLEWRMAWAAFSGMETLLYIFIVMSVSGLLLLGSRRYLFMGILCGAAVWVRPDGLTMLGPLILIIVLTKSTFFQKIKNLLRLGLGFAATLLPYLWFNLVVAGTFMPNTFYAKQAEYAAWQGLPPSQKMAMFLLQFFAGVTIIFLPGFLQAFYSAIKNRTWPVLLLSVWVIGYCFLYVSRLPVYQHGRYIMPAMSVFLLIGLLGWLGSPLRLPYRVARVLPGIAALVLSITFVLGAYAYGQDVALIESQMVETAQWVNKNLPAGSLVAAHDIGALGYFSHFTILDLAGLISPEVVPFIRDDAHLAAYIDSRRVSYLIVFPGWYPALSAHGITVFSAGSQFLPSSELGSLTVYQWQYR